jgi:hypothetical protein
MNTQQIFNAQVKKILAKRHREMLVEQAARHQTLFEALLGISIERDLDPYKPESGTRMRDLVELFNENMGGDSQLPIPAIRKKYGPSEDSFNKVIRAIKGIYESTRKPVKRKNIAIRTGLSTPTVARCLKAGLRSGKLVKNSKGYTAVRGIVAR